MESRWYLFPGQTLENTKISDRVHALHMTKSSWDGITKHLDRKKLIEEAANKEAAVKRYLDEGSKNMTKGWENSLENVRKRKEEERLMLIEQKKDDRQQRFLELRKEQEEIRKKYMDKVKKQIFMTTGHARDLTSALLASEADYERQKQLEFQMKLKNHEKEEERKYEEHVKKQAQEELMEKEEKKKAEEEKRKIYGALLTQQVSKRQQLEKTLKEERIRKEALDNIEAVKEIDKLEELLTHDKILRKKELLEEKKKYLKQRKEEEQQKIKEEKELDEVVEIYKEAKHRIDCMRKQREKEMRDEVVKRRDKIASMVMAVEMDKTAAEENIIKKAIAEREAAELEKNKAKLECNEKMKQERLENIKKVQAREKERQEKEKEIKKWELVNRYKADEHMKKYEESKKKEMWKEVLRYRQELCEQMEDKRVEEQREKALDDALQQSSPEEEDSKFFEYADEVMELAKRKGRSTVPIEKVILKYVKEMNLHPKSCQVDSSRKNSVDDKTTELKKKLIKRPEPKHCRCYCPKK